MKITATIPQKNKQRVNIYIDGKFSFGISLDLYTEKKLKIGSEISEKEVSILIEKDQVNRLINKALRFLSYRPRSEKEIRNYFLWGGKPKSLNKGLEEEKYESSVEKAIKKLRKLGQIDDKVFGKWWVEQRVKFKKTAPSLIKRELLTKGLSKEIIDELSFGDEKELAIQALTKKINILKKIEKQKARNKAYQFLAQKGFNFEIIKKVVDSLL